MRLVSFLFVLAFTMQGAFAAQITKVELNSGWEFRQLNLDNWLPATVPGMVQVDLLANKKIPDPYFGDNWYKVQWVDKVHWEYRTVFDAPQATADENARMVFNGLDCYATVWLNDKVILEANNTFRTWIVDVKNIIKSKDNRLRVVFYSPTQKGLEELTEFGLRLHGYNDWPEKGGMGYNKLMFITRKPGCQYGWDLTPRMLTSGIWRPIVVESWNNARLEDFYTFTKSLDAKKAVMGVSVSVNAAKAGNYNLKITLNGASVKELSRELKAGVNVIDETFEVRSPKLWWPKGTGEPYLYDMSVSLSQGSNILDNRAHKTGIRTTELVRIPDKDGKGCGFGLKINGKPIFCKGSNWVSSDVFMPRVKLEMLDFLVKSVSDVNMNILRVWGGASYEEDYFYEMCDKYGIMVWHDFMFACGMYPDCPKYLANIKAEAEDNVRRLRNHASIVLWCGNNEVEEPWNAYGNAFRVSPWQGFYNKSEIDRLTKAMEAIFETLLGGVVAANYSDNMPYWRSSPSTGMKTGVEKQLTHGDQHYWKVWHNPKLPVEAYYTNVGRFMSEYGMQGFPELASIVRYTPENDLWLNSPTMEAHQGSGNGNNELMKYVGYNFRVPEKFEHKLYMSQLMQAEAMRIAMETHRRSMPWCQGSLIWQINDDWPCTTWSGIDFYGYWKAMHYQMRKSCNNVMITSYQNDGTLDLFVVSDLYKPLKGTLELTLMDFSGKKLKNLKVPVSLGEWSSKKVADYKVTDLLGGQSSKNAVLVCELKVGNDVYKTLHYFEKVKDLNLPKPNVKLEAVASSDGKTRIKVSTDLLAKNVMVMCNGEAGIFSDNFFDLLPGESREITFMDNSPVRAEKKSLSEVKLSSVSVAATYLK